VQGANERETQVPVTETLSPFLAASAAERMRRLLKASEPLALAVEMRADES